MKIIPYTQNGNCYLLTNFSDNNNPMFLSEEDIENFIRRIEKHLSPLCEILGYTFHNDQFLILVVLRDRQTFIDYYLSQKDGEEIQEVQIPESTYILSQSMANLQSGYALYFNKKYKRYGSLFGRRYTKVLIETTEAISELMTRMKSYLKFWDFESFWNYVQNFVNRIKKLVKLAKSECWKTKAELENAERGIFVEGALSLEEFNLRGKYVPQPLPPILAAKIGFFN